MSRQSQRPSATAHRLVVHVGKDRYSARMNTPRHSRHDVSFVPMAPTHRIWKHAEAVTLLRPWPKADLTHVYNRIPLGRTPYVVGFESHMPRYWWSKDDGVARTLRAMLADPRCRAIVASSHAAARIFEDQHEDAPQFGTLKAKLAVLYPNMEMPANADIARPQAAGLRLDVAFVGAHFGRKGGAVAVRLAELARRFKLPIHVTVVSRLEVGRGVWTDPPRRGFFDHYLKLLDAPNVTHLAGAPNGAVLKLLRRMDFSILTTLSDTFGWSVMESMANGAPPIVTPQGALGEFVIDGENGLVIPLDTDRLGEWAHIGDDRTAAAYETVYADEVERMAQATLARLRPLIGAHEELARLRAGARATAERLFCSRQANALWDDLYEDCLSPARGQSALARIRQHTASLAAPRPEATPDAVRISA